MTAANCTMVNILLVTATGCLLFMLQVGTANAINVMKDPDLFEGDIRATSEQIQEMYGRHVSTEGQRFKRAAARDNLWPNGIIPFAFNSSLNQTIQEIILGAIDEYERETCLRFEHIGNSTEGDYLLFTDNYPYCSSYVGRVGGAQCITLPDGCQYHNIILHEIGHSLGLWHEHTRPDRDRYVNILEENIGFDAEGDYLKQCECSVNYHGGIYDYASVMHYTLNEFSFNESYYTIEIINQEEYEQQGSPSVGEAENLSPGDIFKLNRMYNCLPASGRGDLQILVSRATEVPYISDDFTEGELYVLVTATDESGQNLSRSTAGIPFTRSPVWNEHLNFGSGQWRYFDVSIREQFSNDTYVSQKDNGCYRDVTTNYETDAQALCKQTFWVHTDSNDQRASSGPINYCTNTSTCVYLEYDVIYPIYVNDTVVGDPVMTVPIYVQNKTALTPLDEEDLVHLCFELHGQPDVYFNLVSDDCVSVNAHYIQVRPGENINIIDSIAIRAVDSESMCHNITVDLEQCTASVDGIQIDSTYSTNNISIRKYPRLVQITVPNCHSDTGLDMWVYCQTQTFWSTSETNPDGSVATFQADTIRFVIRRGLNLQENANGILGQFWNVPIDVEPYQGPLIDQSMDDQSMFTITMNYPGKDSRQFIALLDYPSWEPDRQLHCLYAGSANAGSVGEVPRWIAANGPVIEGGYKNYIVASQFETDFDLSNFDPSRCL